MPQRTVSAEHDRIDVVVFLAAQFPDRSVTGLRRLVGSGRVTVNGSPAQQARTVRVGDVVEFPSLDAWVPRYVPRAEPPRVLARRDGIIALDKPAGLSVLPERQGKHREDCVLVRALPLIGEGERVYPVHRLDKDTSGVLLMATTRRSARDLSRAFHSRTVKKTYRAVVRGVMLEDEGTIDMPLNRPRRQSQQVRIDFRSGKPAVTHFRVATRYRGFTEVLLFPETGRTHQIRAHLRAIGFPLAVDPIYGSPHGVMLSEFKRGYHAKRGVSEKPLIGRLPLHCESLVFPIPDTEETLEVTSEVPKDVRILLEKLKKWGRMRPRR
jgi:23S rRNA pseudouridine1911/1915/1917 synthase